MAAPIVKLGRAACITALLGFATLLGLAALLGLTTPIAAQDATDPASAVRLEITTDPETIGVADHLRLTLAVETPEDLVVTFPEVGDQLGPFAVLSENEIGPIAAADDLQVMRREFLLEADRAGELTIPPLTVTVHDPGKTDAASVWQLATDPITIVVTSVLPDDADITEPRDIAPPFSLEPPRQLVWLWLAASVPVGVGLAAGLWWYRRRQTPGASPWSVQPAHVVALAELDSLEIADDMSQEQVEQLHVRLADIVRAYVAERFDLRAPMQTTDEFLDALRAPDGPLATWRESLSTLFGHCDLVKFARLRPPRTEIEQAIGDAKAFVERTAGGEFAPPVRARAA